MISEAENRPSGRFFGVEAEEQPLAPPAWSSAAVFEGAESRVEGLASPGKVEVYLSAGPKDDDGSCDTEDEGNCSLYRLVWDLAAGRADSVDLLVPSTLGSDGLRYGAVQAAVSRAGRLAWIERGWMGGEQHKSLLWVGRPGSGEAWRLIAQGREPEERPCFPWFINEGEVVFTREIEADSEAHWKELYRAEVASRAGAGKVVAGHSLIPPDEYSFGNPQYSTVRGQLLTFGETDWVDDKDDPNPHVSTADGNGVTAVVNTESTSCQHPAWSPSGERFLCTRQKPPLLDDDDRGPEAELRPLQVFSEDAVGTWVEEAALLFEPLRYADYPSAFPAGGCRGLLTYKFAHWCGDESHVVATVYCSDGEHHVETSRVLLVDNADPAHPVYHDLTRAIVDHLGRAAEDANWRAVFSVCRERPSP